MKINHLDLRKPKLTRTNDTPQNKHWEQPKIQRYSYTQMKIYTKQKKEKKVK